MIVTSTSVSRMGWVTTRVHTSRTTISKKTSRLPERVIVEKKRKRGVRKGVGGGRGDGGFGAVEMRTSDVILHNDPLFRRVLPSFSHPRPRRRKDEWGSLVLVQVVLPQVKHSLVPMNEEPSQKGGVLIIHRG